MSAGALPGDALFLEVDRTRLDSYHKGTKAISHNAARAWLTELAAGNRTECPVAESSVAESPPP